jgi:hypothetical protein
MIAIARSRAHGVLKNVLARCVLEWLSAVYADARHGGQRRCRLAMDIQWLMVEEILVAPAYSAQSERRFHATVNAV